MSTLPTDQATADLFRALMHPARIAILDLLRSGEQCVCHMECYLGKRQAYISQQLMELREKQIVADRREGPNIYYRVVRPAIFDLLDTARALLGLPQPDLASLEVICSCPLCCSPDCCTDTTITLYPTLPKGGSV